MRSSVHPRGDVVFLFAGQGCQHVGMGALLHGVDEAFDQWLQWLDGSFRTLTGQSLLSVITSSSASPGGLDALILSHPAIYMVELAAAQALSARGVRPDIVLGASLGEVAAAAVAGAVHPLSGLEAVVAQARAIERHCPLGGMLAVLGDLTMQERAGCSTAVVSGPAHVVLAGPKGVLDHRERSLAARGAVCVRMPVGYAFHDAAMDSAREPFFEAARHVSVSFPTRTRYFSSATASELEDLTLQHFWDATRRPVRLWDALQQLESTVRPAAYVDVSPMGTLATVARRALPKDRARCVHALFSPFSAGARGTDAIVGALV